MSLVLNLALPDDDPCCSEPLNAAMLAGMLDSACEWLCPTCGCTWAPHGWHNLRVWKPREWMSLLPLQGR